MTMKTKYLLKRLPLYPAEISFQIDSAMSVLERNGIDKLQWAVTEQRDSCNYLPEKPCPDDGSYPESLGEMIMSNLKQAVQRYMGEMGNEEDAYERVPRQFGSNNE